MKQETKKKKKANVHHTTSELYNELLRKYYDKCCYLSHAKRKNLNRKYKPKKLFIIGYDYSMWTKHEEESTDKEKPTDRKESIDKE